MRTGCLDISDGQCIIMRARGDPRKSDRYINVASSETESTSCEQLSHRQSMSFLITATLAYLVCPNITDGSDAASLWSTPELADGAVLAVAIGALLRSQYIGKAG